MSIVVFDSISAIPEEARTGFEYDRTPGGGVVYIIEGDAGKVKIGRSSFPRKRVNDVCRNSGVNPERIAVTLPIMNSSEVEAEFKREHKHLAVNGEWFAIAFDDAIKFVSGCDAVFDDADAASNSREKDKQREEANKEFFARLFPPSVTQKQTRQASARPTCRSAAQQYVDLAASIFGLEAAHQLWIKLGRLCEEPTLENYAASVNRVMSDDDDPWDQNLPRAA